LPKTAKFVQKQPVFYQKSSKMAKKVAKNEKNAI
jgi:hypothetical protein